MEETFFNFMLERHAIYESRMSGDPAPWTDDPILQDYRFCNVFRELDVVTIWIRENIRERWAGHPNLWFALCVARRINLVETLEDLDTLLIQYNAYDFQSVLDKRKSEGKQIYSSAYMLTTGGRKVPKNEDTAYNILEPLWEKRELINDRLSWVETLQGAHDVFANGHVGFSDFIAYEVVTDLRHTPLLENASDIYTWANPGPGASRGLNRIHDRPIDKKIKACQLNKEMQYLLQEADLYLPDSFPVLEMRDIEHTLCEFDKYMRIKTGKGFVRKKFNGRG